MGNALRRNSFRKHQEKVVSEEVIKENLDQPRSVPAPKEFPQVFPPFFSFILIQQRFIQHLQNHKARGVNKGNSTLMWDYEKGNEPLAPKGFLFGIPCPLFPISCVNFDLM